MFPRCVADVLPPPFNAVTDSTPIVETADCAPDIWAARISCGESASKFRNAYLCRLLLPSTSTASKTIRATSWASPLSGTPQSPPA